VSGSSQLKIQLLGNPRAEIKNQDVPLPSALIRLAANHPVPVRREDLIASLYPEVSPSTARNRLRVALTRLRQRVPLLDLPGDLIGLDPHLVEVDLDEVRRTAHAAAQEPEVQAELTTLRSLLPAFSQVLFPLTEHDWQLIAQAEWSATALVSLDRLAELAEETGDFTTAVAAAEAMLTHTPYAEHAWQRYLRSMARAGRAQDAEFRLVAARRRARKDGIAFPDSLTDWSPSGDSPSQLGPDLTPGENQVLERFFRRALTAEPDLVVAMLGSPSFRPEVIRAPRDVLPLLKEALTLETPASEARERIQVRIITALGSLEDFKAVLDETETFLELPLAPARRRIALMASSFAHAMIGNLPVALAQVEEAMQLATGPLALYDACECRAQRATYLMFGGDLAGAEDEYRACLEFFANHSQEGSEPDTLSIQGNLGINLVHQGRWDEAIQTLKLVTESASALHLDRIGGLYLPALGFALSHADQEWGRTMAKGLRLAYRLSARRAITAAGYAGLAMAAHDPELGRQISAESLAFRGETVVPLNALEQQIWPDGLDQSSPPARPLVDFVRATIRACAAIP
jgi:DNA-binding SARP family transcriptional activator